LNSKNKQNLRNLTYHLISNGRIETSVSMAKKVRKKVEKLITKARKDSVSGRRYAEKRLPDEGVKKLFEVIGPANKERPGGYTRILRTRKRQGDAREMCILEIINV